MRLMMACVAAVLATATLTTGTATAQDVPPVSTTAPSARQMDLTRRYIALTMADQFETVIAEMITDQVALDPETRNLPDADRRFLSDLTVELTTDMIPQMLEAMAPVYAATFTEAELEALISFYDSEIGRSITLKTMASMPEANRASMTVVPVMMEKMASRICEHYGCTTEELQEMRRDMGLIAAPPAPRAK